MRIPRCEASWLRAKHENGESRSREVIPRKAPVQILQTASAGPPGIGERSCRECRVPDAGRSLALNAQASQSELALSNATDQLDHGDRDVGVGQALEAQHRSQTRLHVAVVCLYPVVQVLRRAQSRVLPASIVGAQLVHRPM